MKAKKKKNDNVKKLIKRQVDEEQQRYKSHEMKESPHQGTPISRSKRLTTPNSQENNVGNLLNDQKSWLFGKLTTQDPIKVQKPTTQDLHPLRNVDAMNVHPQFQPSSNTINWNADKSIHSLIPESIQDYTFFNEIRSIFRHMKLSIFNMEHNNIIGAHIIIPYPLLKELSFTYIRVDPTKAPSRIVLCASRVSLKTLDFSKLLIESFFSLLRKDASGTKRVAVPLGSVILLGSKISCEERICLSRELPGTYPLRDLRVDHIHVSILFMNTLYRELFNQLKSEIELLFKQTIFMSSETFRLTIKPMYRFSQVYSTFYDSEILVSGLRSEKSEVRGICLEKTLEPLLNYLESTDLKFVAEHLSYSSNQLSTPCL